ncbi:MAG: hypothetical protein ACE14L_14740 [Terriglobales bacterium]
MELQLTAEEHEVLRSILEQHHRNLLLEIAHADHYGFKVELRRQATVVENLLTRLTAWQAVG